MSCLEESDAGLNRSPPTGPSRWGLGSRIEVGQEAERRHRGDQVGEKPGRRRCPVRTSSIASGATLGRQDHPGCWRGRDAVVRSLGALPKVEIERRGFEECREPRRAPGTASKSHSRLELRCHRLEGFHELDHSRNFPAGTKTPLGPGLGSMNWSICATAATNAGPLAWPSPTMVASLPRT